MRKIKFRAWDERDSEMISWKKISEWDQDGINSFLDMLTDERHAVMQYIGLTDTDGADLYEGDIVMVFLTGDYFEIVWDSTGAGFLFSNTDKEKAKAGAIDYYEFEDIMSSFGFRKVGNIYENPDLLPKAIEPDESA